MPAPINATAPGQQAVEWSAAANPPVAEVVHTDGSGDAVAQIERLGGLRDKGLITDAEFERKKTELLGRL